MAGGKASAKQLIVRERRQEALALRKSGASYRAIASAISNKKDKDGNPLFPSYTQSQAHTDIKACLKELNESTRLDAEEYRALELERLDSLQMAIARQVQSGDVKAIHAALGIIDRRCKLLGLDAPVQIQVKQQVESELEGFVRQLESILPEELFITVLHAIATVEDRREAAARN
jgi:hypothetical protein